MDFFNKKFLEWSDFKIKIATILNNKFYREYLRKIMFDHWQLFLFLLFQSYQIKGNVIYYTLITFLVHSHLYLVYLFGYS